MNPILRDGLYMSLEPTCTDRPLMKQQSKCFPSLVYFGYLNLPRYLCSGNLTLCPARSGLSARAGMQSGKARGFTGWTTKDD